MSAHSLFVNSYWIKRIRNSRKVVYLCMTWWAYKKKLEIVHIFTLTASVPLSLTNYFISHNWFGVSRHLEIQWWAERHLFLLLNCTTGSFCIFRSTLIRLCRCLWKWIDLKIIEIILFLLILFWRWFWLFRYWLSNVNSSPNLQKILLKILLYKRKHSISTRMDVYQHCSI